MFRDIGGKTGERGEDFLADFLVVDDDPVVLFHHDHHFQDIYGIDAELAADQLGVFIESFRGYILQIEDIYELYFQLRDELLHRSLSQFEEDIGKPVFRSRDYHV